MTNIMLLEHAKADLNLTPRQGDWVQNTYRSTWKGIILRDLQGGCVEINVLIDSSGNKLRKPFLKVINVHWLRKIHVPTEAQQNKVAFTSSTGDSKNVQKLKAALERAILEQSKSRAFPEMAHLRSKLDRKSWNIRKRIKGKI